MPVAAIPKVLAVAMEKATRRHPTIARTRLEVRGRLLCGSIVGKALQLSDIPFTPEGVSESGLPERTGLPARRILEIAQALGHDNVPLVETLAIVEALNCAISIDVERDGGGMGDQASLLFRSR